MNDKTKNYLGIAIIVAVLAVAFSALSFVNSYSKSIEPGSFRGFSVTGEGKAVTVPDIAQFSFSVITEGGKDMATLQKENTDKVNKAIAFLKSKGIEAKDIKTESYNVEPRYETTSCGPRALPLGLPQMEASVCPPPSIVGYTINQWVSVKIRDFKIVGDALSGVVVSGANSVSGLNFTIDDRTKVETEARTEAITKAKEKAKAIAKAGGFRLGRLITIEEGGATPFYKQSLAESAYGRGGDMAAATPPTIEAGSQDIIVSVTLRYEID